ncbi:MAG: hypothetical protein HRT35_30590 [Algicola sp.]|nr:hypothetical protein [Algicola sp.]
MPSEIDNWQYHDINFERRTKPINRVNIWRLQWRDGDSGTFEVPHPQHTHQRHTLHPYFVQTKGKRVLFAAGEASNMVWIIYVPSMFDK